MPEHPRRWGRASRVYRAELEGGVILHDRVKNCPDALTHSVPGKLVQNARPALFA